LKREQRLQHLAPQCGFIPPEPLEHAVIEIGEPLEAACEPSLWVNWICGRAVKVIAHTALGVSGAQAGWNRSVKEAIEHVLPLFRLVWWLASMLAVTQNLGLNPKQIGLDCSGATQAPQQRCQPKYEFALDCGLDIIVRDDSRFESAVVIGILNDFDYRFSA
jgi:hypothetical protein